MIYFYLLIIWMLQRESEVYTVYLPVVRTEQVIEGKKEEDDCGWIYPPLENPPICEFW
jgi:hypothetical protein